MKKLITCVLTLFTFCVSFAQEIQTTIVVDSVQTKIESSKVANDEKKSQLKSDIQDQKEILRDQKRIDEKATDERRALAKTQKKLRKEQKELKKEQKRVQKQNREITDTNDKLNDAKKTEIKLNQKLINANNDLVKLQEKFEKGKNESKLSAVESSQFEVKITKKQLEVKKIEEAISNFKK